MKKKYIHRLIAVAAAAAVTVTGMNAQSVAYAVGKEEADSQKMAAVVPEVGEVVKKTTARWDKKQETRENNWKLVWSDEFNTGKLDLTKWDYQTGDGSENGVAGWGNEEKEYYTDGDENGSNNISFDKEHLIITAKKEGMKNSSYTSGKLWTKGDAYQDKSASQPLFQKKYGRVEAKMKLPAGTGYWPAFWMMPTEDVYGGWASSGEIDIMEARGRDTGSVDGTIHFGTGWPNDKALGGVYNQEKQPGFDFTKEHEYAVEWLPGEIRWYVDDVCYKTLSDWYCVGADNRESFTYPAPFDQEFYLILNLAVGGNYDGGKLDDIDGGQMAVDYVRVYDLCDEAGNVHDYAEDERSVEPQRTAVLPGNESLADIYDGIPEDEAKEPSKGGEHIYNGTFDQGNNKDGMDGYTRLRFWKTTGGAAAAVANENERRLTLTPGTGAEAGILQQGTQLLGKDTYRLTFDASAAAARDLTVQISGEDGREYESRRIPLTTELTEQEIEFTVPQNAAVQNGSVKFISGNAGAAVTLDNVSLKRLTNHNVDYSDIRMYPLENGSFVNGMAGWSVYGDPKISVKDGICTAAVVPGVNAWDQMLISNTLALGKGMTYEMHFEAKADRAGEPYTVKIENAEYTAVMNEQYITSENWQEHDLTFTASEGGDMELKFLLAQVSAECRISFRNIRLSAANAPVLQPPYLYTGRMLREGEEVSYHLSYAEGTREAWLAADKTVLVNGRESAFTCNTKKDTLTIPDSVMGKEGRYAIKIITDGFDPVLIPVQKVYPAGKNLVLNGSFNRNLADWENCWFNPGEGTPAGSISVTRAGEAKVDVLWANDFWDLQMAQEGIPLKAGGKYAVTFDARSTIDRPVNLEINQKKYGFKLGGTYQTYTCYYEPQKDEEGKLILYFGKLTVENSSTPAQAHSIYLDNISVARVDEEESCSYRIEHYVGDGGNYVLKETEEGTAAPNTEVMAEPKNYKGYTFDSNISGSRISGNVGTESGTLTLRLYYKVDTYQISYELNQKNAVNTGNPSSYTYGKGAALKAPVCSGFVFKGWYLDAACTRRIEQIETSQTGAVRLYAKWEAQAVKRIAVQKVTLKPGTITLKKGKTAILKAVVYPSNAQNKKVSFSSSNPKAAVVDRNGKVKAVGKGNARITVKTQDGGKKAVCTVKVLVPAKKVTLNTGSVYLVKGKSVSVKAIMSPLDTTDRLTWSTSKKSVAAVKNGKITAKKTGTATITVKTDSGKKAICKVHVVKKAKKSVSIRLNKKSAVLKKGQQLTLKPSLKPYNSTDFVKWKSSDKKKASVNAFGTVTAKKAGTVTITAVTSSGKKVTCKIKIK